MLEFNCIILLCNLFHIKRYSTFSYTTCYSGGEERSTWNPAGIYQDLGLVRLKDRKAQASHSEDTAVAHVLVLPTSLLNGENSCCERSQSSRFLLSTQKPSALWKAVYHQKLEWAVSQIPTNAQILFYGTRWGHCHHCLANVQLKNWTVRADTLGSKLFNCYLRFLNYDSSAMPAFCALPVRLCGSRGQRNM